MLVKIRKLYDKFTNFMLKAQSYLDFAKFDKISSKLDKLYNELDSLKNLLSHEDGDYKIAADFTRAKAKEFCFFNYEIGFPEIR